MRKLIYCLFSVSNGRQELKKGNYTGIFELTPAVQVIAVNHYIHKHNNAPLPQLSEIMNEIDKSGYFSKNRLDILAY